MYDISRRIRVDEWKIEVENLLGHVARSCEISLHYVTGVSSKRVWSVAMKPFRSNGNPSSRGDGTHDFPSRVEREIFIGRNDDPHVLHVWVSVKRSLNNLCFNLFYIYICVCVYLFFPAYIFMDRPWLNHHVFGRNNYLQLNIYIYIVYTYLSYIREW